MKTLYSFSIPDVNYISSPSYLYLQQKKKNSPSDQLPRCVGESGEHCTGIVEGHRFESSSSLKFLQAFFLILLSCVHSFDNLLRVQADIFE